MNDIAKFMMTFYRNGIYQGVYDQANEERCGYGLLYMVQNHIIIGSKWEYDMANGPTFIYYEDGNYMYGFWKNNAPHGFNILRLGSMLIMGFYLQGKLVGNILVLYEKYNLAVIFSIKDENNDHKLSIITKGEVFSDEDFQKFIQNSGWDYFQQNWKTLIKFLSANFLDEEYSKNPKLKLRLVNQSYYKFGYDEGLALIFDDEYRMISIGNHHKMKLIGLGIRKNKSDFYEQGNFRMQDKIFAYNQQSSKPTNKINQAYNEQLLKSVDFVNKCVIDPAKIIIKYYIELADCNLFKSILAGQITNRKLDLSYDSPYRSNKQKVPQYKKVHLLSLPTAAEVTPQNDYLSKFASEQNFSPQDFQDEKKRLEFYEKQILQEIAKKKTNNYVNLSEQKIQNDRLIINKAPVIINPKSKNRKIQRPGKSKQKRRSPIFTPEKTSGKDYSPVVSPSKPNISPFREKMKQKMVNVNRKNQKYLYQPIQQVSPSQQIKLFKLSKPEDKYASPYHQLPLQYSKGQSFQQNSMNFAPISMKLSNIQNNPKKKATQNIESTTQERRKQKKSSETFKDQTPQFIPIQDNIKPSSSKKQAKKRSNNIYIENLDKKELEYDHRVERSKPKSYLVEYQRKKSTQNKNNKDRDESTKKYGKTIRAFNDSNKIYDIVSSPKSKQKKIEMYEYYDRNRENALKTQSYNKRNKYEYYYQ